MTGVLVLSAVAIDTPYRLRTSRALVMHSEDPLQGLADEMLRSSASRISRERAYAVGSSRSAFFAANSTCLVLAGHVRHSLSDGILEDEIALFMAVSSIANDVTVRTIAPRYLLWIIRFRTMVSAVAP